MQRSELARYASEWQRRWHDLFDADPPKENDGPRPQSLGQVREDFRILLGFPWVEAETRRACLEPLPRGDAIWPLLEEFLTRPLASITADQAIDRLAQGVAQLRDKAGHTTLDMTPVRILSEAEMPIHEAFRSASVPTIDLDDDLWDRAARSCGPAGVAAFDFLSEVFYWSGNDYTLAHFALWPLCADGDDEADNPYRPFMELVRGGWSVGWDKSGLFLFDRLVERGGKREHLE